MAAAATAALAAFLAAAAAVAEAAAAAAAEAATAAACSASARILTSKSLEAAGKFLLKARSKDWSRLSSSEQRIITDVF